MMYVSQQCGQKSFGSEIFFKKKEKKKNQKQTNSA